MARFETEILSTKGTLKHLMGLSGQWIDRKRPVAGRIAGSGTMGAFSPTRKSYRCPLSTVVP
jgi:hypothetical protein